MHKGVDLSNYQGTIDYGALKASGVEFAYVLATDGQFFTSPTVVDQVNGCRQAGILVGLYHFFRPDMTVGDQVGQFLQTYHAVQSDLRPALDVETQSANGYAAVARNAMEWVTNLEGAIHTPPTLLYVNVTFAQNLSGFPWNRPVWLADPSNVGPNIPRLILQSGVVNNIDQDQFVGSDADWAAYIGSPSPNVTPQPQEDDDDMAFLSKDPASAGWWVVANDLTSKRFILTGSDLTGFQAAGYKEVDLSQEMLDRIPDLSAGEHVSVDKMPNETVTETVTSG